MKIDITSPSSATQSVGEGRTPKTGGKPAETGNTPVSSVVIGDLSSRLKADSGDTQVVNRSRVEEIKQAIASGNIAINPANIADGLLDSVKDMLGNK